MTYLRRFGLVPPLAAVSLASCGLNSVPTSEEKVNAAWANLQADYQRRNDLVGNLVQTVKAAAKQESTVLVGVAEARSRATQVQLAPTDLSNPSKVQQFANAQQAVSNSIRPLLGPMIQERYPELKSLNNFSMLQDQLEGTENRILVSRRDYNTAVQDYNTRIRTFPDAIGAKIFYGAKPKVPFQAAAGSENAPKVDFGN
ncbi:LemA family protein [Sphingomonas ginkgonis]|uniref:LemA family protein n=1 Tax=Sphingomonas ginkgonis TaxID=2315330 RepID=A0A3R9YK08_9SPHN|nr:LemA family protein [Sphingomonas ginkgonis]RST31619.1 LemA family protein [Sphingomonas ginkgonis]